jgi:hypothetical protein
MRLSEEEVFEKGLFASLNRELVQGKEPPLIGNKGRVIGSAGEFPLRFILQEIDDFATIKLAYQQRQETVHQGQYHANHAFSRQLAHRTAGVSGAGLA